MVMDLRCSYCSNKITVRDVQPIDGELKIRCPGCKNILIVRVFPYMKLSNIRNILWGSSP